MDLTEGCPVVHLTKQNKKIMRLNTIDRQAQKLLEDSSHDYLWENFFEYNSNYTLNFLAVHSLKESSLKLQTLWRINLDSMHQKDLKFAFKWCLSNKKLFNKTSNEVIELYYKGQRHGLMKGDHRSDLLSLFMYSPSEIKAFYEGIPILNIINPLTGKSLVHALTAKTINYFHRVQPWYNVFLLEQLNTKISPIFVESCSNVRFKLICRNFVSPINVFTNPIRLNSDQRFVSHNLERFDLVLIKKRFNTISGKEEEGYSCFFWAKLINTFCIMLNYNISAYGNYKLEANNEYKGFIKDWKSIIYIDHDHNKKGLQATLPLPLPLPLPHDKTLTPKFYAFVDYILLYKTYLLERHVESAAADLDENYYFHENYRFFGVLQTNAYIFYFNDCKKLREKNNDFFLKNQKLSNEQILDELKIIKFKFENYWPVIIKNIH